MQVRLIILKLISIHSLVRGRTLDWLLRTVRAVDFNPLPRKRENQTDNHQHQSVYNFNPLPRKRENEEQPHYRLFWFYFNPLPRKRENSHSPLISRLAPKISIHSLVRGRTAIIMGRLTADPISIHSLVRGRTTLAVTLSSKDRISIHSLVRGRTEQYVRATYNGNIFQSTPS